MRAKIKALFTRWFLKKSIGDGMRNTFFYRYCLIETPWFGVYIHRFVRGDMDRCLHDHPWNFLAIVLWGGYREEMFCSPVAEVWDRDNGKFLGLAAKEIHWRRPGSILWRSSATAHRITLDPSKPKPISLVFVGRKIRPWGFFTVNGWKPWKKGEPNPICETN